jgi:hypothetical protein
MTESLQIHPSFFIPALAPSVSHHSGAIIAAWSYPRNPATEDGYLCFARSIACMISPLASAASPQPSSFTHLPGSRSL